MTKAIASGDTEAFARFYRGWFDFVLAQARATSRGDEQFCLDIVQETMLKIIRRLKPLETEAALRGWLCAAIRSSCLDLIRRELRRRRREQKYARQRSGHFESTGRHDQLDWLGQQLARLEPSQRKLLAMRFRFGWTLQQIGEALGLKPGAVDGRIGRLLSSLREQAMEESHE